MLHQEIFNSFRTVADESGVLFYYTGSFSQSIVAAIGDTLRQRLEDVSASNGARRKVFSSFIEMAQNILHYSAEAPNDGDARPFKQGALAVGREGEKFFVVCGNPVRAEDVPRLQEKLEPLRRMSLDEIKSAYRAQLRNDERAADAISKGAGLGFLTVARDATEPIEYSIVYAANPEASAGRVDLYLKAII
ncbi:MAG TPA: SiaB family protein kinase [Rhodocyclaceae bacterium]|nr:SiaB family protein kinase [Rhodocyclaceae bacterium]